MEDDYGDEFDAESPTKPVVAKKESPKRPKTADSDDSYGYGDDDFEDE